MLIEENIRCILHHLKLGQAIEFALSGMMIKMELLEEKTELSLQGLIYQGDAYIPSSVRHCLTRSPPFSSHFIRTYLTVNENEFQIYLNYLGNIENLAQENLKEIVEEFRDLGEQWRSYLDEFDKHDLIYVRVK